MLSSQVKLSADIQYASDLSMRGHKNQGTKSIIPKCTALLSGFHSKLN